MRYDLEERTHRFAAAVRALVKKVPWTPANAEDTRQLIRASGSVGANYIEANDALGRKDFVMRVRISRKEAKESGYWLSLLDVESVPMLESQRQALLQEAGELAKIFGAIIRNTTAHNRP